MDCWAITSAATRLDCGAPMTPSARRPGPESTLDDVRAKLVTAGTKLLRERGAELGLSQITLSDTIAEAGVSRSTAYRSLAHQDLAPQAVLHQEVLTQLLGRYGKGTSTDAIATAVAHELERHAAVMTNGTVQERTVLLRSLIRIGANTSFTDLIESPERSLLTAVYGSLQSSPAPPDWRHEALRQGEANLTRMFSELYTGLIEMFDYAVQEPFTMDQLVALGASLVEGLAMRHGFNDQVTIVERATGPGGATEQWSLFAIAFEKLFVTICAPRNGENPFADLGAY